MNPAQRRLIVASLCGIAAASPFYCLEYRSIDYWATDGGRLFDSKLAPPIPSLIALSKTEIIPAIAREAGVTRVTGLYPRPGLAFQAAAVGGLLAPIILLVAGVYLALAARSGNRVMLSERSNASGLNIPLPNHQHPAAAETAASQLESYPLKEPRISDPTARKNVPPPGRGLHRAVAIATVVAPVFWVIDMPSMLLMMGLRFPRWVFWLLVIREFGR